MQNSAKNIYAILNGKDKKVYKFHFVGIGGVSMCSLANLLLDLNQEVSGSDTKRSDNTQKLAKRGAGIFYRHEQKNVEGCDFVIYSYAVWNNLEVQEAKKLNIPTLSRAEFLRLVLKKYKTSICVSGAHGKTTTTALIYSVLKDAGVNPSLHLGGTLVGDGKSSVFNNSEYIVCEACEYMDAFLKLKPNVAIVLNTAPEHLDYFKTYNNVKKSFAKFAKNADVLICEEESTFLNNKIKITFGGVSSNYIAKHIVIQKDGTYAFDCYKNGRLYGKFLLNLVGLHNVKNALATIAVSDYLSINKKHIRNALKNFEGVERRFQVLKNNPLIIHDYAHHPDEINATLNVLKNYYNGNLLVVFQPHTYSRTKYLMKSFVECFKELENVAIFKTFSAREKYDKLGSAKELSKNIGANSIYFNNESTLQQFVLKKIQKGYAVIFLGAGSIDKIAKNIVKLC